MGSTRVSFSNRDGQSLAGLLEVPASPPRAYALFAHCFTCSKDLRAAANISHSLADAGIAVLRFDFTGLGESEGDFADSSFSANVADLIAAARYLEETHAAPAILIGHSLGGTAILKAATDIPSAVAVATIGAPATPAHLHHLFAETREEIEERGAAQVDIGGRPFTIKKQFLEDLERHELPVSIGGLGKALLIMHAPLDDIVEIECASELFRHARHPKSFISLDKADHLLSRAEDSRYAGAALAAWALRYLPEADAQATGAAAEVLATTHMGGFRTAMSVAGFPMIADEPSSYGGSNLGPTPYDLLSAALAACTTMTLRMYSARKKLPLNSVSAIVRHDKIHAKDCEDCETVEGRVDQFQRTLSFDGELSDQQRQRLLEIADMCPVHRTLHSEVKIRTRPGE